MLNPNLKQDKVSLKDGVNNMKNKLLVGLVLALSCSSAGLAQDTAQLEVSGSIQPLCMLDLIQHGQSFDLSPSAPFQLVADVGIWCNDGVGFAKTTYESLSQGGNGPGTNGFYGANHNQYIGYLARLYNGGSELTMPLTNSVTLTQVAGTGLGGVFTYSEMHMQAITNGSEMADTYTAMIQITVEPF